MPVIRSSIDHGLMERQRQARLEREGQRKRRIDELRASRTTHSIMGIDNPTNENAARFWDNINTSGGLDACHPWTGRKNWNHPIDSGWERFQQGDFRHPELQTKISTRVLMFMTYGRELPPTMDVTPLCGDHLCHNLRHLVITKHGGHDIEAKLNGGVPAEEFFCASVCA